jgi:ATP-dependent RNA helicase DDX10/DBP4
VLNLSLIKILSPYTALWMWNVLNVILFLMISVNLELVLKQILVLDEADRILDHGFRAEVDAILGELPQVRQTLLFSATQTKSVKDLARVSLTNPEYISVHAEAVTATPERLKQLAMVVPLDQKLDMLWSFIRRHVKCKILVFLTTCKQVRNSERTDTLYKLRVKM